MQAAGKLILQKILIMRPRANIAIFRLGISLLTALPIACFDAHQAISQTDDIYCRILPKTTLLTIRSIAVPQLMKRVVMPTRKPKHKI
ncbi:MAG: hypothetical protein EAZ60_14960 [Oscillatoriales cyanobacterium]|nr:MAG: hypothetical protein EAZ60_14960 [Oscillatoriales cyanobacterium]